MRKLSALLLLTAMVLLAWYGARWWRHRDDLRLTLVVADAGAVRRGAHVVHDGLVIGEVRKVTELDDDHALSIRVGSEHRGHMLRDSMITIDDGTVVVDNTLAVGRRAENGDVLRVQDDSVRRWIAKQSEKLAPFVSRVREIARSGKLESLAGAEAVIEEWKQDLPKWKREGKEALERRVAELEAAVRKAEEQLRKRGREVEARELRKKYDRFLAELREEQGSP